MLDTDTLAVLWYGFWALLGGALMVAAVAFTIRLTWALLVLGWQAGSWLAGLVA